MRRIISICKEVPLLPIAIIAAIPLALLGSWRPWEAAGVSLTFGPFNPGVGQWIVIALVVYTIVVTVIGMIDDLRHGHVGVDLLAVIAIASTVAVQEYWAAWAVVLMISSGEAIEEFAQSKAEGNLTALVDAAPRTAHVVTLPGVGARAAAAGADGTAGDAEGDMTADGFRKVASVDVPNAAETNKSTTQTKPYDAAGEHFETVPVDQVKLGDVILVLPGETVPVDGELLSGVATLDLSNINGEPVPREVYAGARVLSGAVNGSTALTMRATQLAQDSQYQKILELVSSAQESRPTVVKTADVLAVPFTILSLAIAGIAWAVAGTPLRFAQVLVLATPCPLLIAAPVAYVAGTGRLAKAGILIKAQDVLENLGRVSHIFFDKTGTLTVKQPQVVRVEKPFENSSPYDENHILMMAGVVEGYSVHILSKGIAAAGQKAMQELYARYENGQRLCAERDLPGHGRDYPVVKNIEEQSGKGVSGEVNGHAVRVGRFAYVTADEAGFTHVLGAGVAAGTAAGAVADSAVGDSATGTAAGASKKPEVNSLFAPLEPDEMAAYVAIDGKLAARIVLRDVPRENAKSSLEKTAPARREETVHAHRRQGGFRTHHRGRGRHRRRAIRTLPRRQGRGRQERHGRRAPKPAGVGQGRTARGRRIHDPTGDDDGRRRRERRPRAGGCGHRHGHDRRHVHRRVRIGAGGHHERRHRLRAARHRHRPPHEESDAAGGAGRPWIGDYRHGRGRVQPHSGGRRRVHAGSDRRGQHPVGAHRPARPRVAPVAATSRAELG